MIIAVAAVVGNPLGRSLLFHGIENNNFGSLKINCRINRKNLYFKSVEMGLKKIKEAFLYFHSYFLVEKGSSKKLMRSVVSSKGFNNYLGTKASYI